MLKLNPLKALSILALLFCVGLACKETGSSGKQDSTKTLKSADGKYQLTVPSDWTSRTTKENEVLGASSPSETIVLIVAFQNKIDLADDMTLDKYTDLGRTNQLKAVGKDATQPGPINNGAGRQYEITITTDNTKVRCVITTTDGADRFFRATACTLPSKYDDSKAVMKEASESFRAVESTSEASPTSSH